MAPYLAHSADPRRGIPPHLYCDHIRSVVRIALDRAEEMLKSHTSKGLKDSLLVCIKNAADFHDLGKLLEYCQEVLAGIRTGKMPNHVDAGPALFRNILFAKAYEAATSKGNDPDFTYLIVAILIWSHHIGILNRWDKDPTITLTEESLANPNFLRDMSSLGKFPDLVTQYATVKDYTDHNIEKLCVKHNMATGDLPTPPPKPIHFGNFSALDLRLLASCLFYADHTDTAMAHLDIGITEDTKTFKIMAKERLTALGLWRKKQFSKKNDSCSPSRKKARNRVFANARKVSTKYDVYMLDTPVGTAKTMAALAIALRLNDVHDLRGIIWAAPYMSIIDQVVGVFRNSIQLPEEAGFDMEKVVAAHHHLTDYGLSDSNRSRARLCRAISVNWFAPITVTSAEQLIESLASNLVPVVKKLHNLPRKVIVIDEFHTIPPKLWGWLLHILKQLVQKDTWNCKVIFVSGTPIEFWKLEQIREHFDKVNVKKVVTPNTSRSVSMLEHHRIDYHLFNNGDSVSFWDMADRISNEGGARIVSLATVQNAAIMAQLCANRIGHENVYHLSTSIAPIHRRAIMSEIAERLKDENRRNFVLVGTSCIESGLDFSFDTGFIEAKSISSSAQLPGRVNRGADPTAGDMYVFVLTNENGWRTSHPAFETSSDILLQIMKENPQINKATIQRSIVEELARGNIKDFIESTISYEKVFDMRGVRKSISLINTFGVGVICNPAVVELLIQHDLRGQNAINIARDHLGLPDRANCKITPGWLSQVVQDHSFTINLHGEEELLKKGYPFIDLSHRVSDNTQQDYLDKGRLEGMHLLAWDGDYGHDFLGYMHYVLRQKEVPGVMPLISPMECIRPLLADLVL